MRGILLAAVVVLVGVAAVAAALAVGDSWALLAACGGLIVGVGLFAVEASPDPPDETES